MNIKNIINAGLGVLNIPTLMPSKAKVNLIAEVKESQHRVSQLMMLKDGLLLCVYNNKTRHNSYLYKINKDGSGLRCIHNSNTKETIGMSYDTVKYNGTKVYVLPSEESAKNGILFVDYNTGNVGTLPFRAPYQYSEVALGGVAYFASRGNGGFFDCINGTKLNMQLSPIPGIVFGMVEDDGDYVCACDDGGLISSAGWVIGDFTSDVNFAGKRMLAFLREGKVRLVKGKKLSSEICHTNVKPRRSVQDKANSLCYWTTHGPQQLWVTNGKDAKKLADFGGDVVQEAWKEGSCFSSAVAFDDVETLFVATTIEKNSGWRLYKVDIKW